MYILNVHLSLRCQIGSLKLAAPPSKAQSRNRREIFPYFASPAFQLLDVNAIELGQINVQHHTASSNKTDRLVDILRWYGQPHALPYDKAEAYRVWIENAKWFQFGKRKALRSASDCSAPLRLV
jgi:hypothetical protein